MAEHLPGWQSCSFVLLYTQIVSLPLECVCVCCCCGYHTCWHFGLLLAVVDVVATDVVASAECVLSMCPPTRLTAASLLLLMFVCDSI